MANSELENVDWKRSRFSSQDGKAVEVAGRGSNEVVIRSPEDPRTVLRVDLRDWSVFLKGIRAGQFRFEETVFSGLASLPKPRRGTWYGRAT